MAKAKITLECKTCRKSFQHEKDCCNRADANQYETWARDNVTECPSCYYKRISDEKAKEAEQKTSALDLPEITQGSEKQIAWAKKIRAEILSEWPYEDYIGILRYYLSGRVPKKVLAKYPGMTAEQALEEAKKDKNAAKTLIMLTATDATTIIDNR